MTDESVDMLVVTGLDETACKLEEIKDITKRARDVAFTMIIFYEQFKSIKSAVFKPCILYLLTLPFCFCLFDLIFTSTQQSFCYAGRSSWVEQVLS